MYTNDLAAAMSSLIIIAIGWIMAGITTKLWMEKRKPVLLQASILFFTLPSPWVPDVITFALSAFTEIDIPDALGIYSSAWSIPIFATTWVYMTGAFYSKQPWVKYVALSLSTVLGLVFYFYVYVLNEWVTSDIPNSDLRNLDYELIPNIIVLLFGLAGIAFIFPSYAVFAYRAEKPLLRIRCGAIAIGALLFASAGVMDALVTYESIIGFVIVRILIAGALLSLYVGYTTPARIKAKYGEKPE